MLKSSIALVFFCLIAPGFSDKSFAEEKDKWATAQTEWEDLRDDMSRSQLASYELLKFGPPADRAIRRSFRFPSDSLDGFIYGIDVSHHNGEIDWPQVKVAGAKFVYIKATQGKKYRDSRFFANWKGASNEKDFRRGAYHFLSANVSGAEQANSFLTLLNSAGGLEEQDLAPVLDIEWDMVTIDGKKNDAWGMYPAEQIAKVAQEWLDTVQKATNRRPIIYTSASWWNVRMGDSELLKSYPHWIADYRVSSIRNGAPKAVKKHPYRAWQFTDIGSVDGSSAKFDVSRLQGTDFKTLTGK